MNSGRATTGVALVGCGYVIDYYLATMRNHRELSVAGVFDRDRHRAENIASRYGLRRYPSLEAVLADERVAVVANLTSPDSHHAVSRAALLAGKHVYSEKPFATTYPQAEELVRLAERHGLVLSSAPCNLLGETAQTMWLCVRRGDIGTPQLAYAELDDGAVHRMPYRTWRSESGVPWPYRTEFRSGCTLEHAGYYLGWLLAMFGAVSELTSFSTNIVRDVPGVDHPAADFATACLRFRSGMVARLTCSIVAPTDRSLLIVGDEGVLRTADAWDFGSPVQIRRARPLGTPGHLRLAEPVPYPLVRPADFPHRYDGFHAMDFARGIAEVAQAATEQRRSRLSARHALHALELMLAMTNGQNRTFDTAVEPVEPMPWATGRRTTVASVVGDAVKAGSDIGEAPRCGEVLSR